VFSCFEFRLEHLFPLFAGEEISLLEKVLHKFGSFKIYPASSVVAEECRELLEQTPAKFDLGHRCHALRIIGVLLTHEFNAIKGLQNGTAARDDHPADVLDRLSAKDLVNIPVEALARKFSCSRRQLNRVFHERFGYSVSALRMEMRMQKAASLLRSPRAKVINVAEDCGFNHLGLFNVCFKKRFKMTPSEWRKNCSSIDNTLNGSMAGSAGDALRALGLSASLATNTLNGTNGTAVPKDFPHHAGPPPKH
jgi:AraC-like DNA-binding protein